MIRGGCGRLNLRLYFPVVVSRVACGTPRVMMPPDPVNGL